VANCQLSVVRCLTLAIDHWQLTTDKSQDYSLNFQFSSIFNFLPPPSTLHPPPYTHTADDQLVNDPRNDTFQIVRLGHAQQHGMIA
jgi:hypothetical protein